jgi:hypothetical protein
MTRVTHDPLSGVKLVLVDATNLLHAMARRADRLPASALIGRIRAAIPAPALIVLVFDGPVEPRVRGERIASGLSVRYGGGRSADAVILDLAADAARAATPGTALGDDVLVVSDDRDLRHRCQSMGCRTAGAGWLIGRLERPSSVPASIGNRRPRSAGQIRR